MPQIQTVEMFTCTMRSPTDMSEVRDVIERIQPRDIVAVIGKTHGNGLHDDYGRELADLRLRETIGSALRLSREEVAKQIAVILSGGAFGVITPHVTVVTRQMADGEPAAGAGKRLVVGRQFSEEILPEEIGRVGQIEKVADAVAKARDEAGVTANEDVHCVMVKAPSLSQLAVDDALSRGKTVATRELGSGPNGSMAYANDASALGVAVALGEVKHDDIADEVVRRNWEMFSSVASTSSGGEKTRAEVLLLGNSDFSASSLRIGHGLTKDFLDQTGIKEALRDAGLEFDCCPTEEQSRKVVAILAKLIIPDGAEVRGYPTTLRDDLEAAKSTKCVGGALIGSVVGMSRIYMSGGEPNSHQGPPGMSPVAAVVRV